MFGEALGREHGEDEVKHVDDPTRSKPFDAKNPDPNQHIGFGEVRYPPMRFGGEGLTPQANRS